MKRLISILLMIFLALASGAKAYTVNGSTYTTTGAQADFQAAVNAAPSGGTIVFSSGTYQWSSTGTTVNKSLTITAAPGTVQILNQNNLGTMLSFVSGTDGHIHLNGINFKQAVTWSNTGLGNCQIAFARSDTLPPTAGNQYTVIVTNCTFDVGSQWGYSGEVRSNGIIFSHCTFTGGIGLDGLQITCNYSTEHWNTPDTMGLVQDQTVYNGIGNGYSTTASSNHLNVGDTAQGYMGYAGLNDTYIEDCNIISNGSSGSMNADGCARVVLRYCSFTDSCPFCHGQDSSEHGGRHFEVCNCTFHVTPGNPNNVNYWVDARGAGMLVYNNTFDAVSGKTTVQMDIEQINRNAGPGACQLTYPANRQCGIGWSSSSASTYGNPVVSFDGTGEASDPIFIWNNGGSGGNGYANYVVVHQSSPDDCGHGLVATDFIKPNRDYYVGTARPGWVAYTYPHPLLGGSPTPTPTPTSTPTPTPTPTPSTTPTPLAPQNFHIVSSNAPVQLISATSPVAGSVALTWTYPAADRSRTLSSICRVDKRGTGQIREEQLLVERDNNLLADRASSFRLRMRLRGG